MVAVYVAIAPGCLEFQPDAVVAGVVRTDIGTDSGHVSAAIDAVPPAPLARSASDGVVAAGVGASSDTVQDLSL